MNSFQY